MKPKNWGWCCRCYKGKYSRTFYRYSHDANIGIFPYLHKISPFYLLASIAYIIIFIKAMSSAILMKLSVALLTKAHEVIWIIGYRQSFLTVIV